MILRAREMGAEIFLEDETNIKPLLKAMIQDAFLRERHLAAKQDPGYERPVFPNKPWPRSSHWA